MQALRFTPGASWEMLGAYVDKSEPGGAAGLVRQLEGSAYSPKGGFALNLLDFARIATSLAATQPHDAGRLANTYLEIKYGGFRGGLGPNELLALRELQGAILEKTGMSHSDFAGAFRFLFLNQPMLPAVGPGAQSGRGW